jgi:hypothetical protein
MMVVVLLHRHVQQLKVDPTLDEALALRWCLNWIQATNQGGHFLVEMDIGVCVKCLEGKIDVASTSNVMLDCCGILSSFSNCMVTFIKMCKNVMLIV